MGIIYNRKNRWKKNEIYSPLLNKTRLFNTLNIGGGDEPDLNIEDLHDFVKTALFLFVDTLSAVGDYYLKILKEAGIEIDEENRIPLSR
ncbi:MAG: hypothetical protein KAG97_00280 [Victivallales bacterium]|nr:hypothetical protein [Victivallales bacterium]